MLMLLTPWRCATRRVVLIDGTHGVASKAVCIPLHEQRERGGFRLGCGDADVTIGIDLGHLEQELLFCRTLARLVAERSSGAVCRRDADHAWRRQVMLRQPSLLHRRRAAPGCVRHDSRHDHNDRGLHPILLGRRGRIENRFRHCRYLPELLGSLEMRDCDCSIQVYHIQTHLSI